MPRARFVSVSILVVATMLAPRPVRADAAVETTIELADRLFKEGQQLLDKGDPASVEEACKRFAESQRLDPKLGRLLNLAVCHAKQGKTASAYEEFREAASWASQKGQKEREEFARKEAAAIEKKLSFVDVSLPSGVAPTDVTKLTIDGNELARERWANPFPLDPGKHVAVLSANGKKDATVAFELKDPGVQAVQVPPFEAGAASSDATTAAGPGGADAGGSATSSGGGSRTAGWIVGGLGVAALGVGAYFGLHAASKKSDADPHCPDKACDAEGSSLVHDARVSATISTIAIGVGVVGVAIGTYLVIKPAKGVTTGFAPMVSPQFAGLHVETTF
jgi:hypothetical protein